MLLEGIIKDNGTKFLLPLKEAHRCTGATVLPSMDTTVSKKRLGFFFHVYSCEEYVF